MGVRRFRTFEDARRALWLDSGDPRILERLQRLSELSRSRPTRRGVFRFHTFEEANQHRRAATPPT